MRKILLHIFLLILGFTMQVCIFPQISVLASYPNLLLILVSVFSFTEGKEKGLLYGAVAGMLMDLFYSGPFGFYTLFFLNMGYLNGMLSRYYYEDYITLPLTLSVINDFAYNLYIYVFRFLIRGRTDFLYYFTRITLPEVIFTAVVTLAVYRFILWLGHRVERWEQRRESDFV